MKTIYKWNDFNVHSKSWCMLVGISLWVSALYISDNISSLFFTVALLFILWSISFAKFEVKQ